MTVPWWQAPKGMAMGRLSRLESRPSRASRLNTRQSAPAQRSQFSPERSRPSAKRCPPLLLLAPVPQECVTTQGSSCSLKLSSQVTATLRPALVDCVYQREESIRETLETGKVQSDYKMACRHTGGLLHLRPTSKSCMRCCRESVLLQDIHLQPLLLFTMSNSRLLAWGSTLLIPLQSSSHHLHHLKVACSC